MNTAGPSPTPAERPLGESRRCGVIGSPIRHSLSPLLHRAAYAEAGLDWTYEAHQVDWAGLASFLAGLDDSWRGLSLTMPLKRAVLPLLDEISPLAAQAGAVNTVVLEGGRRVGHNTDVTGAVAAVRERVRQPVRTAVVLGGGATAAAVLLALADLGCRTILLVVRDAARAQPTAQVGARLPGAPTVQVAQFDAVGPELAGQADILVSTIPADAQQALALPLAGEVPTLFDVVYDPWPTPLDRLARSQGQTFVSGLDLLAHQAVGQFQLMTGLQMSPLGTMRAAAERALG